MNEMTDEISVVNRGLDSTIAAFEKLKGVAEYLASSDTFVKDFEVKDKDGKPIIDEQTGKPKVNTTDIALCLMAGNELGLNITGSLLYGKKLNQATYMAVMKGRSMGVDIATSIEKIVSIPTKNGYVSYTMVDIISAKLVQGGVQFLPFIKNYAPFYIYRNANMEELDIDIILDSDTDELKDNYFVANLGTENNQTIIKNKEAVEKAKSEGKTIIIKERHGYYSKAKFTRTLANGATVVHYQRFSTLDAERAGLLPVSQMVNGQSVEISKGKDNWISNTPQMMNNRIISIAGRIIGADLIQGIYTREEVVNSGLIDEKDAPVIDTTAEIIK